MRLLCVSYCRFEADRLAWAHERGVLVGEAAKLRGKVEVRLTSLCALDLECIYEVECCLPVLSNSRLSCAWCTHERKCVGRLAPSTLLGRRFLHVFNVIMQFIYS